MTTAFDFKATDIDGKERSLDEFKGKAVLVVNTASKCGFTPQYAGLEQLWKDYGDKGLKWNFTKFLVGRDGQVLKRFAPTDKPESLRKDIEKALG